MVVLAIFTGIVEEIGTVTKITKKTLSVNLTIRASKILEDVKIGDSIAVNGVCLTVVEYQKNEFTADVMYETLKKTNLYHLNIGSKVNLERALRASDRLGGHIVTGHIDGIGVINKVEKQDIALLITIEAPSDLMRYMVNKGSIAVDGTSLTIVNVISNQFCVSLIPHTAGNTILGNKKLGDSVNLEVDILAKYIERLLKLSSNTDADKIKEGINYDMLKRHGFL